MEAYRRARALFGTFVLVAVIAPDTASGEKPVPLTKGIPYQQQIIVGSGDSRCSAFGCDVPFPPVPAGKRLVVQHVSLEQILLSGFSSSATLRTNGFGPQDIRIELIPQEGDISGGRVLVRYSQPVFGFVDPGVTPLIQTGAGGAGIDTSGSTAYFLSGFLVPAK